MNRRRFLGLATAAAASPQVWAAESPHALVARTDRDRILRLAAKWAAEKPQTLTSFPKPAGRPGTAHDYTSDADYYWPDPANQDGPFKERDGLSNPTNFNDHRLALIRLSQAMPALTAGFVLTGNKQWAALATAHLRAWFIDPATRMNPNLQYAQGVRNGGPSGRQYGIIDTLHLVEVARAATRVLGRLTNAERDTLLTWFHDYVAWMNTSTFGQHERDGTNNHGLAWALQVAEFSRLTADTAMLQAVCDRWHGTQLPGQMAADGSFPRETARTKPYGYSIFTFDVATALAWSLGGADELRYKLPDGRGLCRAAEFLVPFLADKSKWPFPHDVQHWESWPVRSPGLLFAGIACARPDYLTLWRTLDADPTDPEIIRNFPIRQPILWV